MAEHLRELLAPHAFHLAVQAALEGLVPCDLYPVACHSGAVVLLRVSRRVFLGADPTVAPPDTTQCVLAERVRESVLPHPLLEHGFLLFHPGEPWLQPLTEAVLRGSKTYTPRREHYLIRLGAELPPEPALPPGFVVQPVTPALLEDKSIENLPWLLEEITSERATFNEFFAQSFGVVIRHHNRLVAWCLSEYNLPERCEVGIATDEPYQRQGFARAVGRAFLAQAAERGITEVGWDCWKQNTASVATAKALGFHLSREYGCIYVARD